MKVVEIGNIGLAKEMTGVLMGRRGGEVKEGYLDDETSRMILKAKVEMMAQYMSAKTAGEKVRFRVPTEKGPVLITVEKEKPS